MISKYIKQLSASSSGFLKHFEGILRQAVSNTISLRILLSLQHQAEDVGICAGAPQGEDLGAARPRFPASLSNR